MSSLDERYGRTRRRILDMRIAWVSAGALSVFALLFVFFVDWSQTGQLRVQDLSNSVLDEQHIRVNFEVSGMRNKKVACAVEALSELKGVAGWKVVVVEPGATDRRLFSETVETVQPAVAGHAKQCWVVR